jgi:hypothetical protein
MLHTTPNRKHPRALLGEPGVSPCGLVAPAGFDPTAENFVWLTWSSKATWAHLCFRGPNGDERLEKARVLYYDSLTTEDLVPPSGAFLDRLRRLLGL